MAKRTFVYRGGQLVELQRAPNDRPDDKERIMIEGTQGERVLRGYRDLEAAGQYRHKPGTDSADAIKRAWRGEVTGRFK